MKRLLITVLLVLTSCSPTYVIRAAYEEGSILWNRREIAKVLEDEKTDPHVARQLELVSDVRTFAVECGLNPGGSFKTYSAINKDVLSWLVVASRDDSFELYTWWFPFVGRVPYKGFFDREEAVAEAERLKRKGYETSIRPVEAFSTLGWFDDPVLTPLLKHHPVEVANTVLHESVHSTIWIKGHVPFNESLAHFVGLTQIAKYFSCKEDLSNLQVAQALKEREFATASVVNGLHEELSSLYASDLPREEKLLKKREIFDRWVKPFKEQKNHPLLQELNNAALMQMKIYLTGLGDFQTLYDRKNGDLREFLQAVEQLSQEAKERNVDPMDYLKDLHVSS